MVDSFDVQKKTRPGMDALKTPQCVEGGARRRILPQTLSVTYRAMAVPILESNKIINLQV